MTNTRKGIISCLMLEYFWFIKKVVSLKYRFGGKSNKNNLRFEIKTACLPGWRSGGRGRGGGGAGAALPLPLSRCSVTWLRQVQLPLIGRRLWAVRGQTQHTHTLCWSHQRINSLISSNYLIRYTSLKSFKCGCSWWTDGWWLNLHCHLYSSVVISNKMFSIIL